MTYNLALEVIHHHFQHILLATQVEPIQCGEDSKGNEYQDIRVIGGLLGGWLQHRTIRHKSQGKIRLQAKSQPQPDCAVNSEVLITP